MTFLRNLMLAFGIAIFAYTFFAVIRDGFDLYQTFFGDLISLTWRGQFNLDFAFYLMLSGLWLAWRSGFSRSGVIRGLLAANLGMMFLAPQMLVLIARSRGDMRALLLGVHAADSARTAP